METAGVDQEIIDKMVAGNMRLELGRELLAKQVQEAKELKEQLAIISKMDFPNLSVAQGAYASQLAMYGSQTGPAAPKDPPKAKTGGGGKTDKEKLAEYLQGKQQELTLEKQLVGVFGAERDIKSELFEVEQKYGKLIDTTQDSELAGTLRQIEAEKERNAVVEEAKAQQKALADTIASSMETAMMSMVDGTKTVKEAFKDMARDIIKHLYKVLVIQQAINALGGFMSGSSNPVISSIGGGLESYDGGGYTGDGPRSGGMDGRGGRLAVIHPKETVIDHTKPNSGSGGQNVVINQSFNFQANGDDSVKKIIAQAAPQIAQMTKSSLLNDRRRGGATKAAFG
jgi:hypothetical protein